MRVILVVTNYGVYKTAKERQSYKKMVQEGELNNVYVLGGRPPQPSVGGSKGESDDEI